MVYVFYRLNRGRCFVPVFFVQIYGLYAITHTVLHICRIFCWIPNIANVDIIPFLSKKITSEGGKSGVTYISPVLAGYDYSVLYSTCILYNCTGLIFRDGVPYWHGHNFVCLWRRHNSCADVLLL